jgi:hypothetical protein
MSVDKSPPRRTTDDDGDDHRAERRQISGDEVQVGVGKYTLTLRGGMVISVVLGLAILIGIGYQIRDQERFQAEVLSKIDAGTRATIRATHEGFGLQTCVLALTPAERVRWRESREPRQWLLSMCPSLLLQAPETPAP